jgi:hypothetical protein
MDSANRQVYRSTSGSIGRRTGSLVEPRFKETSRRVSRIALKRVVESSFKKNFGSEIDLDKIEEDFSKIQEVEDIANSRVEEPTFPIVTFNIALVIDVLNLFDVTGFGWFVLVCVKIVFVVVLYFLMWGKVSRLFKYGSKKLYRGKKSFVQRYLRKYMGRRLALTFIFDLLSLLLY